MAEMDDEDFYYTPEVRKLLEQEPTIVEASYHMEAGFEFLNLKLSDGRRLLIPKEDLPELKNATDEQAMEIKILPTGTGIWWPQIDDGLYLPTFLEHRWGKVGRGVAA
jgi:hypothetical protein